jgi:hypothetical protein
MDIWNQIEILRLHFRDDDTAIRDALNRELKRYVCVVVRREIRKFTNGPRTRAVEVDNDCCPNSRWNRADELTVRTMADEICRQLTDRLLQMPAVEWETGKASETLRAVLDTIVRKKPP